MIAATLAFVSAIALAGVAAWFSITGLMAIFAALPLSIAIMAGVLEVAKLVTASLLYRNWSTIPTLMKGYLTTAVVVLMLITSLGIFGYLSKAHLDQNAPVSSNIAKIERLEQRIEREERSISDAETIIAQLDSTIATLIEYDKISGDDGARAVRENQRPQRETLEAEIDAAQERIDSYLDEKFEYEQTVRDFETEVGPIKYIAALAYDNPAEHYDTSVRAIILLLVFVFDPLAVLLLITANHIQMRERDPDSELEDLFEDDIVEHEHTDDNSEMSNTSEQYIDTSVTQEESLGDVEKAFYDAEVIDPGQTEPGVPWRVQLQDEWVEQDEDEDEVHESTDPEFVAPSPEEMKKEEVAVDPQENLTPRQQQQKAAVQRQVDALQNLARRRESVASTNINSITGGPLSNTLKDDVVDNSKNIG